MSGAALRAVGALTNVQALALSRGASPAIGPGPAPSVPPNAHILVVRLDETIGDSVMFSPFLRELRAFRPDSRIDLVINAGRRDMFAACPYVDRVVPTTLGSAADHRVLRRPFDARRLLRSERLHHYDLAVAPRVDYDHHAAFVVAASRAPTRLGFTDDSSVRKAVVNRGVSRLFTHAIAAEPHRHEIDRQLDLLRQLGHQPGQVMPEVWLDADSRAEATRAIEAAGIDRPFVVLAPSGGHSDLKQWPLDRYIEIARVLRDGGRLAAFIGGPSDRALMERLPDDVRSSAVDLVGQLKPMATAAVIERAAGFVGADSGMSHVSAALGVATVAVFGPTCVHAFAPRGPRSTVVMHQLPCGPCARGANIDRCDRCIFASPICMSSVSAGEVLDALNSMLAG